jgi:hypothetical protein
LNPIGGAIKVVVRVIFRLLIISFLLLCIDCKTTNPKSNHNIKIENANSTNGVWILPIPDGGDVKPSRPSVQGHLISINNNLITLDNERRKGKTKNTTISRLTSETELFTSFGGYCKTKDLHPNQYAWIWYVTKDSKKAGTPPKIAVLMIWSKDPKDQPTVKSKWQFD